MKHVFLLSSALILFSGCNSNKLIVTHRTSNKGDFASITNYKSVETRDKVQDSTLSLAMSIAGGGSRSSNFGKGVLLELETINYKQSNVLHEIDYFSTVSGGGHAAGAYIASLFEYDQQKTHNAPYSFNEFFKNQYKDLGFRFKTQPQWFYVFFQTFPRHRGNLLEKRVDDHVLLRKKTGKSILLGDIFVNHKSATEVKFPMLIASSSCLENKIKVPFTPEQLNKYKLRSYFHRFKHVTDTSMYNLPLAVSLTSSGTVPMMVPPMVFKVKKKTYMRFVDGGLTDNSGIQTALDVLDQTGKSNANSVNKIRKKILIVDDTPSGIGEDYYVGVSEKNGKPISVKKRKRNKYQVTSLVWYGLDSRYISFYQEITEHAKCRQQLTGIEAIDHVILDFRVLLRDPESPYAENSTDIHISDTVLYKKETMKYLLDKYENKSILLDSKKDRIALYEMVTNVDTKYEASDLERRTLLLAGRMVVRMQKKRILDLLSEKN
jgi:hypothetical protein